MADLSRATARIATRAELLGFARPPLTLRLKIRERDGVTTLFVQPIPAAPFAGALDWLAPLRPRGIAIGPDHVIRAEIAPPPGAWAASLRAVRVDLLRIEPDGSATLTASGERAALAALATHLGAQGPTDVQQVAPARPPSHLLTAAQDEAIRAAVASGYYDIPRPLTLHDLATRLGVTSAALSERLRRAEGRIIKRYTRLDGADPWTADEEGPGELPDR